MQVKFVVVLHYAFCTLFSMDDYPSQLLHVNNPYNNLSTDNFMVHQFAFFVQLVLFIMSHLKMLNDVISYIF